MFNSVSQGMRTALPLLALLPVGVFILGRFWWPGETSAWAASIRIALAVFLFGYLFSGQWGAVLERAKLWLPLAVLAGWVVISVAVLGGDAEILRRGFVLLVFLLAVAVLTREKEHWLQTLLQWAAVVGALLAMLTIVMKLQKIGLDFGYRAFRLHSSGIPGLAEFFNPIISGMHFAFAGLTAFWCLMRTRHRPQLVLWSVCLLVIALYIFLTFARSAWLAMALGGVVLMLCHARLWHWLAMLASTALGLALAVLRFPTMFAVEGERGVTYRELIWQQVLDSMPGHWLQGHGAGVAMTGMQIPGQVVVNTHSLYLEVLFQYGVPGLLLFVVLLVFALQRLCQRLTAVSSLCFSLLVAAIGVAFFELHSFIHSPNLIWLWVWLPIGVALASVSPRKVAVQ